MWSSAKHCTYHCLLILCNFHQNLKRSTLEAAAKTPNYRQSHFHGILEELMSCVVLLPREGNVCRDVVLKTVCFWEVRTKQLLGSLHWREPARQVSYEIMFKIIIKVESTMAEPFLLIKHNQTRVIFRPVSIIYEAQGNITNAIYQNNSITAS